MLCVFVVSGAAWADLTGSSVSGTLKLNASSANCFDPSVVSSNPDCTIGGAAYIPAGAGNSSGPTITVPDYFAFASAPHAFQANFSSNLLDVYYICSSETCPMPDWVMTFVDSAFLGATFTEIGPAPFSTAFATDPTAALIGNTITISLDGQQVETGIYGIEYSIETPTTGVPEPSSLLLLGAGLIPAGGVLRRRLRLRA
ncbi:MAG TPA: PEP-CTERM sorting domain-containing protein [Terriglobales bacterium]|nr:PEP-CTERM sorting domain-containing protein [Terriglobales bacterium]